jgi:hypothetical protein
VYERHRVVVGSWSGSLAPLRRGGVRLVDDGAQPVADGTGEAAAGDSVPERGQQVQHCDGVDQDESDGERHREAGDAVAADVAQCHQRVQRGADQQTEQDQVPAEVAEGRDQARGHGLHGLHDEGDGRDDETSQTELRAALDDNGMRDADLELHLVGGRAHPLVSRRHGHLRRARERTQLSLPCAAVRAPSPGVHHLVPITTTLALDEEFDRTGRWHPQAT